MPENWPIDTFKMTFMSATFSILVTASPTQSQGHLSAIRFIESALKLGHKISRVFFYQEAVLVASKYTLKPSDELQLSQKWLLLANQNDFELHVCVAAANRRGVITSDEASLNKIQGDSALSGFEISGLGILAAELSTKNTQTHQQLHFK